MKKRRSRFPSMFMFLVVAIMLMAQSTYADQNLVQKSANVPSDWAKEEIKRAKDYDLLPEKIEGKYQSSITREEFSELAVRLYETLSGKEGLTQGESPFRDTKNMKVVIANNLGIVKGKGDGKFDPYNEVTREELSVMLYRTLKAAKPEYTFSDINEYYFADYNRISSWAREAVGYLYGVGVINGVGENQFNPGGNTSREAAIVLASRMHEKVSAAEKASRNNLVVSRSTTSRQENFMKYKLEGLIAQEMGKPYQWGGTGPDSYDCSGLVYSIFGKLGVSLPRTSKTQAGAGTYVAKDQLVYGDLVFFARDGRNINHVGIYVGNGEFAHAPESGQVVKTTTLMSGYYANSYYTARRVLR